MLNRDILQLRCESNPRLFWVYSKLFVVVVVNMGHELFLDYILGVIVLGLLILFVNSLHWLIHDCILFVVSHEVSSLAKS